MKRSVLLLFALLGMVVASPAQTASDPDEGSKLTHDPANATFSLSWWGQAGRTYFVLQSDDLFTWSYVPLIESGAEEVITWGFTSTADKFFLRLKYSDTPTSAPLTADFDGDKISNWQELLNGTDPLQWTDSDGDGLPDDWEIAYSLNPLVPDADDSDVDEDGVSLGAEYSAGTNPTLADTDGDGVDDGADHFPCDERRSESLPVSYYGAIDLTEDLPDFGPVQSIALDNDNQVAFANFWSGDVSLPAKVAIWKDGEITSSYTVPHYEESADYRLYRNHTCVNSSGTLFGSWSKYYYLPETPSENGGFTATASGITSFQVGTPTWWVQVNHASDSGAISGWAAWGPNKVFCGQPGSLTIFNYWEDPWQDTTAMSRAGVCAGVGRSGANEGGFLLANGTLQYLGNFHPLYWMVPFAVNDQSQIVGDSQSVDAAGYPLGFYYTPSIGTAQRFPDLLPAKYRKQLRSAIPYLITNADPTTGKPTIVFRAESLEGDSEGDWITRTFSLSWTPEGEAVIAEIFVSSGEDGSELDLQLRMINAKGLAVAFEDFPMLIEPMEFQAVNILLGFDLPIANDQQTLGGEKDKKGEWWTSVISEPASGRVNDNIKFVCTGGQPPAAKLGVEAKNKLADHLIVTDPGNFTAETPITMTAKPDADRQQRTTQVIVKSKRLNGDLARTVQVLNVDVLPLRTIKLGIWFLHDTVHGAPMVPVAFRDTTRILEELNAIYESQAGIRFVLDTENSGPLDWAFDFPTASGPPDGVLDDLNPLQFNHELPQILNWELPSKVNLVLTNRFWSGNLGITRDTNRSIVATEPFATTRGMDDFFTTCAHEIGHQLGLSTRDPRPLGQQHQPHHNHDAKYFPVRDYYEDGRRVVPYAKRIAKPDPEINQRLRYGLMTQDTPPGKWHWIRHEDWKAANNKAEEFDP